MMQTCGLTDGFVRTGMIASTYGQVSLNATRCKNLGPVGLRAALNAGREPRGAKRGRERRAS